jgi:hypothetical protein
MLKKNLGETYSPLYFLSALGAGGLSITFFVYLNFFTSHKGNPISTWDTLQPYMFNEQWHISALTIGAMVALAVLTTLHLSLLFWNIREYRQFKETKAYKALVKSNNEVALMAIPLTLAMTVSVLFAAGAVFIPGLWAVAEYLFPAAIFALAVIGYYAVTMYGRYLTRLFTTGDFDFSENNNLSQMLAIFAFAMIGVGMAAPGAMSHHPQVSALGMFGAMLFLTIVIVLGLIKLVLGFKSILKYGVAELASPSLWIMIPILTLVGITLIRITMGLHHGFDGDASPAGFFVLTAFIVSLQMLFAAIGYAVMKKVGYFDKFIKGDAAHPGSYSLVCPGVASFVFGMFFVFYGLIKNGLVEPFSIGFFVVIAPLVWIQLKTISTLFILNRKMIFTKS